MTPRTRRRPTGAALQARTESEERVLILAALRVVTELRTRAGDPLPADTEPVLSALQLMADARRPRL